MATSHEIEQSPAAKALARVAGWREALRERFEALSFRHLTGRGGVSPRRQRAGGRRRPPASRRRELVRRRR